MDTYVKSGGVERDVQKISVKAGGVEREIKKVYVKSGGVERLVFENAINLVIAANTTNYDIKAATLAAGWDGVSAVAVILTINAGVFVRSTSTGTAGIVTGVSWPGGSSVKIVNNGYIQGKGGAGGAGDPASGAGAAGAGSAGGHALDLGIDVTIDNTNGYILGGGGGGGGGGDGEL